MRHSNFFFTRRFLLLESRNFFSCPESSFRIVLSSRKISLRKFQLAFSMRDFPCWKDRIFQAGFCLFVQKFRVIEMIPRGNISGKTRNVVDRDFQCRSPSRATKKKKSQGEKGETTGVRRVGKVATSRATPRAGLPTSGVRRGERRDEKRDLLCFSFSLSLSRAERKRPRPREGD